jgi:peptidoglycan/xylan/chitin deacetylase (PgdA/CDA1 family)
VLPNGMHVYGTEEEAVALAEQLTGKPAVVVEKKPKKPIVLTLDDGASVETAPIYPVYRKKEAPENFIGMTQTADAVLIRAEIISNLLEEQKRKRRRKMAAMLLL